MSKFSIILPIRTFSESNMRSHWAVKAKRSKEQRTAAHAHILAAKRFFTLPEKPWRITLTRIGKKRLDTGNNPGSMKAVQDGICDALGIDDGDEAHDWIYKQRVEKRYVVEVLIEHNDWNEKPPQ
jgi:hypothetical protein